MTLSEVLENFDRERANKLPLLTKIMWVSQLDMKIHNEILKPRGKSSFKGYTTATPHDTVVLAPDSYGELYTIYLGMRLDFLNGEIARHNNSARLFNITYADMFDCINRDTPVSKKTDLKAGDCNV